MRLAWWFGIFGVLASAAAASVPARPQGNSSAIQASRIAIQQSESAPPSDNYRQVQQRLARGWNTWDVHSVTTQVLLPEGLAIRVGMQHNTTENSDAYLGDALIGRMGKSDEVVTPGPHAWDGSYTELTVAWKGHTWRVQSAHDRKDLVLLVTPLKNEGALPPTVVVSVGMLWNLNSGMVTAGKGPIVTTGANGA